MERLIDSLSASGYDRAAQVTTRGQFAVRGGILDVFSWQAQLPVRAEFFGDEIESLREFDVDTQTSVRNLPAVDLLLGAAEEKGAQVRDYLATDHLRIVVGTGGRRRGADPDQRRFPDGGRRGRLRRRLPRCGCARVRGRRFHAPGSEAGAIRRPAAGMEIRRSPHRHLLLDRRGDRAFPRNHECSRSRSGRRGVARRNAGARLLVSGRQSRSAFRRPSFSAVTRCTAGGCSAPSDSRAIGRRSTSASSRKASSWSTSSTAWAVFSS